MISIKLSSLLQLFPRNRFLFAVDKHAGTSFVSLAEPRSRRLARRQIYQCHRVALGIMLSFTGGVACPNHRLVAVKPPACFFFLRLGVFASAFKLLHLDSLAIKTKALFRWGLRPVGTRTVGVRFYSVEIPEVLFLFEATFVVRDDFKCPRKNRKHRYFK
jgi:hypothetical protein